MAQQCGTCVGFTKKSPATAPLPVLPIPVPSYRIFCVLMHMHGRIERMMVGKMPAPSYAYGINYSYSIMLLIHQGHQSKVKVVAKAKSTGLYIVWASGTYSLRKF